MIEIDRYQIDRNGRTTKYSYDNLNRVKSEEWVNGNNTFTYTYDKNGNRLTANDGSIEYDYSYDKTDLLTRVDRLSNSHPTVSFKYETESEKQALQYQRFNHPHPRVQMKMETVFLKSQNLSNEMICTIVGGSENTLRNYLKDYREGGIEKLKELKFNQPKSELEKHKETLEECFRKTPPATINEAVSRK
jgi:YD repeat-containing protein